MDNCAQCTKLRSINKQTDAGCKKKKIKIEEVRLGCPEDITETLSATTETACASGYVSNLVAADIPTKPTPLISIDVLNPNELDETNEFTFNRDEDEGDDQYNLTPILVKAYDPEHQCTLDSLKGQDVVVFFKLENKDGDYVWRRVFVKLTGVTGGLIAGYQLTLNADNPSDEERPLFVNISDASATTTAIDALTDFGT